MIGGGCEVQMRSVGLLGLLGLWGCTNPKGEWLGICNEQVRLQLQLPKKGEDPVVGRLWAMDHPGDALDLQCSPWKGAFRSVTVQSCQGTWLSNAAVAEENDFLLDVIVEKEDNAEFLQGSCTWQGTVGQASLLRILEPASEDTGDTGQDTGDSGQDSGTTSAQNTRAQ